MGRRLNQLTGAQIERLSEFRDKWIEIGLSTGPVDREAAQGAIAEAYRAANLKPPTIFVWLSSPLEGCVGSAMLAQVRDQVWDQVWDQVGDRVWDQVWDQVGDQVGDQVWDRVWAQVGDRVGDQVWAQVWAQVGAQVRAQVRAQVYRCGYGSHDANWLAFYDYFHTVCDLRLERLDGLWGLSQCGWWWPFEGAVIFTERPSQLRRDEDGRLHCETDAAIKYPDGWGVWAWHGVRVPQWVIEKPEKITVQTIESERNAEIRRVQIERYGYGRYLRDTGAELVNKDTFGTLWRKADGDNPLTIVEVLNSTPEPDGTRKKYFIPVPPEMRTAREAVAWTFGFDDATEYSPNIET